MQKYAVSIPQTTSPADTMKFSHNMLNLLKSNPSILRGTRTIAEDWTERLYLKDLTPFGLYFRTSGKEYYAVTQELASLLGDCVKSLFFDWRLPGKLYGSIIRNHMPNIRVLCVDLDEPFRGKTIMDGRMNFKDNLSSIFEACGDLEVVRLRLGSMTSHCYGPIQDYINNIKFLTLYLRDGSNSAINDFFQYIMEFIVPSSQRSRCEQIDLVYPDPNSASDDRIISFRKKRGKNALSRNITEE